MDRNNSDLDDFLAAARSEAPLPSGDLLARIEAQALAEQPVAGPRSRPEPVWRQVLAVLGGWPGAAGLAAACAAGLWLGISPPAVVDGLLGADTAGLGTLGIDPLSGFDLALMEG
jgi:anti-sigma-K factor RskA